MISYKINKLRWLYMHSNILNLKNMSKLYKLLLKLKRKKFHYSKMNTNKHLKKKRQFKMNYKCNLFINYISIIININSLNFSYTALEE